MRGSYSSKGVDVGGGNLVAPMGEYNLIIKRVFDTDKEGFQKVTKKGDPMVSVLCQIEGGEFEGSTVFHNVVFFGKDESGKPKKGAGMAVHFLKVIGEPWEGDFDYDTDKWVGRTFRAKLKVTKDLNDMPKNEIAFLIDPLPSDGPVLGAKEETDAVPF